ncbi:hypothetical protein IIW_00087 [Bacillus cereus VD136]|nr:hypothetical protein IIW_00087 [Bacillus cereus VD136]
MMMETLMLPVVILFCISFCFAVKLVYEYRVERKELVRHLAEITEVQHDMKKKKRKHGLKEKILALADDLSAIGSKVQILSESKEVESWLKKAGQPKNMTVDRFQGLKIALFLIGFFTGFAWVIVGLPFAQIIMIAFPFLGYFYPIYWIKSIAKRRQEEIRLEIPDFLDMMSVTLQVGLGFDQALAKILPYFKGALGEEFQRFTQEIKLGVRREQALDNLLDRNDCPELQALIKSLLQGIQLGVPISTTFKHQAEDMRVMQQERVKELASKASPKITLITTFFIAPTAIIMIVGLIVMNFIFGENGISSVFK